MQPYHIIPLCTAFVYTVAALSLKRSTNDGVGPWRTTFFNNLALFAVSFPFWFFGQPIETPMELLGPFCISVFFFLGQLFTCLAIHKGDVSLVTPLMGTKPVLVGLIASFFFREAIGMQVWLGAGLSTLAILLMSLGSPTEKGRVLPSLTLGMLSSLAFALCDLFTQSFGARVGFERIVSGTFTFNMLWACLLIPKFRSPVSAISGKAWTWLGAGSALLASQAMGMTFVLSKFGHATTVNVLYSSRGIWSVALVWGIGHWFSNDERSLGRGVMLRRFGGAVLLVLAIVVVIG